MRKGAKSTKAVRRPMTIPIEYAGRWIAMNRDRTQILESDVDLDALLQRLGTPDRRSVVLFHAPRADQIFVG